MNYDFSFVFTELLKVEEYYRKSVLDAMIYHTKNFQSIAIDDYYEKKLEFLEKIKMQLEKQQEQEQEQEQEQQMMTNEQEQQQQMMTNEIIQKFKNLIRLPVSLEAFNMLTFDEQQFLSIEYFKNQSDTNEMNNQSDTNEMNNFENKILKIDKLIRMNQINWKMLKNECKLLAIELNKQPTNEMLNRFDENMVNLNKVEKKLMNTTFERQFYKKAQNLTNMENIIDLKNQLLNLLNKSKEKFFERTKERNRIVNEKRQQWIEKMKQQLESFNLVDKQYERDYQKKKRKSLMIDKDIEKPLNITRYYILDNNNNNEKFYYFSTSDFKDKISKEQNIVLINVVLRVYKEYNKDKKLQDFEKFKQIKQSKAIEKLKKVRRRLNKEEQEMEKDKMEKDKMEIEKLNLKAPIKYLKNYNTELYKFFNEKGGFLIPVELYYKINEIKQYEYQYISPVPLNINVINEKLINVPIKTN